ncbi:MAG TPA: MgtC/SapB family protein [Steroidobacteraceae bacterium]|nr:MgtC/SapB family protein [Steroidobacteraceae bacterium]
MNLLMNELFGSSLDAQQLVRAGVRLTFAALIGASIGLQRQLNGKAAGLRTHMLVALGTTMFVLTCVLAGMPEDGLTRVMQGIATGIGFLGAGAILKVEREQEILGLTTAADIWLTAAASVAVGIGHYATAIAVTILACLVLSVLVRVEQRINEARDRHRPRIP